MKKLFLLVLLHCIVLTASSEISVWNGAETKICNGIGTEKDPFLIESAENLAYLCNGSTYEGKFFKVTVDIDLNKLDWTPIAAFEEQPFMGSIDFNNHIIYNLSVSSERSAGLFGYIKNAIIKNVQFDSSCYTHGYNLAGMLVGKSQSSQIAAVINNGEVFSDGLESYTGGVIGYDIKSTITDVINNGQIYNKDKSSGSSYPIVSVGGIVGMAEETLILRCGNKGYVHGYSVMATAIYNVGGITGSTTNNTTIEYCFNKGSIASLLRYVRWHNGGTKAFVGGITGGTSKSNRTISSCYNTGNVSGCSYWSGSYASIVSDGNNPNIQRCYSTWNIEGCEADSYTAKNEERNGIKSTVEEINSAYIVNILNNGTNYFVKDEYPYVNEGVPFFSSLQAISVKTEEAIDISSTSSTLRGAAFATGLKIKEKGFRYKEMGATTYNSVIVFYNDATVNNLKPSQKYVYQFYVVCDNGETYYGEELEFTTNGIKSEIYTIQAKDVSDISATLAGAILLADDETLQECGFEFFSETEANSPLIVKPTMEDSEYFFYFAEGLYPQTRYIYRAYAKLNIGTIYGDYKNFSTAKSTSIESVVVTKRHTRNIYNTQGHRLKTLQKGINIMRFPDGTTLKVFKR